LISVRNQTDGGDQSETPSPQTGSDAYKALRAEKNLLKQGEDCSALLFRMLPEKQQKQLAGDMRLSQDELPILAVLQDSETWLIATSRRVAWSRPGFKHELAYSQITDIGLSELSALEAPEEHERMSGAYMEERGNKISNIKAQSPRLYLSDEARRRHEAFLPPGRTLFAIWDMIRFMSHLEEIHPSPKSA
jgi:hypothetical protein